MRLRPRRPSARSRTPAGATRSSGEAAVRRTSWTQASTIQASCPGAGAFTSGGGCAVQSLGHTNWPANTDILLRKTIDLPANTTDIMITGGIDNDTFVYWNGELLGQSVGHEGCPGTTDFSYARPRAHRL